MSRFWIVDSVYPSPGDGWDSPGSACCGRGSRCVHAIDRLDGWSRSQLRRAATPELATLIQDALRRRNELAAYARREIYRELATYLQSEISPFPDELIERLSDEQYLINASGILFGDQRPSRIQG
jgi:hypothetical protein